MLLFLLFLKNLLPWLWATISWARAKPGYTIVSSSPYEAGGGFPFYRWGSCTPQRWRDSSKVSQLLSRDPPGAYACHFSVSLPTRTISKSAGQPFYWWLLNLGDWDEKVIASDSGRLGFSPRACIISNVVQLLLTPPILGPQFEKHWFSQWCYQSPPESTPATGRCA